MAAGADRPLVRVAATAEHVHGSRGLGSVSLPAAALRASDTHGVDFIIETLAASPGEVHLVATGPLTNIALALQREPRITQWAASFTIMGGSFTRGNATPAAEFNIFADPDAAAIVFDAGWQVVMIGLDLTLQAIVTEGIEQRMLALGPLGTELVQPLATFWTNPLDDEWDGQALHDVCAVAYIARPDLFTSSLAHVDVETRGEFTNGMTLVDFSAEQTGRSINALVPRRLEVDAFWDYVLGSWGLVAAGRNG